MKIKIDGKVYVQNYEVAYIMHKTSSYPMGITQEVFDEKDVFAVNGPVEALRFGSVFEEASNVKWLMDQEWILDFEEYAKMSLQELEDLYDYYRAECIAGIEKFNAQNEDYRDLHFEEEDEKYNKFSHMIASIGTLISAHKGEVTFVLPSCYKGKTIPGTKVISTTKKKSPFFKFKRGAH